jgi:hypothetical protein
MTDIFTPSMFPQTRKDQMDAFAQSFDRQNLPKDLRMRLDHIIADASESAFLARMLEYIRPGVLEVAYPELKGKLLVPVDSNFDPGAEYYTYQAADHVGTAEVGGGYANSAPRADVNMLDSTQKIQPIKAAYAYTFQENRNAMMNRRSIAAEKAVAARDIIERAADTIIFLGHTAGGLKGLLTLANTNTYTVPAGTSGTTWDLKTTDEVLADLNGVSNIIVTATNEAESPDSLLLPLTSDNLARSRRVGDGTSKNIMAYFLENQERIKNVANTFRAESNAAWTGKRMVAYRKDPSKIVAPLLPFEQLAPQPEMYGIVTPCHARSGGVVAMFPKSLAYGDGI